MTNTPTDEQAVYLIQKQGAYYRPNSSGYTTSALTAGRYTKTEAERASHPNGPHGPRDGMSYIHEDDVECENLAFHRKAISAMPSPTVGEAAMVLLTAREEMLEIDPNRRPFPKNVLVNLCGLTLRALTQAPQEGE